MAFVDTFHFLLISVANSVMTNTLDCSPEVSKFQLESYYYIYFRTNILGKDMNLFMPPAMR